MNESSTETLSTTVSEQEIITETQEERESFFNQKTEEQNTEIGTPQFDALTFSWGSYASSIGIILFMLFMLYAVLWLLRKYGKGRFITTSEFRREDLHVEAQLPLGPKKHLYVVKYMNRRLLLGAADSSLTLLSEDYIITPTSDNTSSTEAKAEDIAEFANTLKQISEPHMCKVSKL